MRNKIVIVSFVGLILLAAAYRFIQIAPYPQGGGRYLESPDKGFVANASNLTDCSFFGEERSYYEFVIEAESHQRLRRMVIEAPSEGMVQWREEGTIKWAADSSSVTYSFKGTDLTLALKP